MIPLYHTSAKNIKEYKNKFLAASQQNYKSKRKGVNMFNFKILSWFPKNHLFLKELFFEGMLDASVIVTESESQ